ncbi:UGT-62 protein [Aphelenchoides avenae]|nr:UGT-62 protein [Aphelenchus avenae]
MGKTVATPLEEPFLSIIGNADKAVIFSFGSLANASSMPWAWKEAFMKAFASLLDVTFILRYGETDLDAIKPSNVLTSSWIPQTDLLHHPKVRAMITHGGYNSIQEIISAGKPIVCIPLFGNVQKLC